jgi:patatin-like phospholipase/acyl hydrolase
MNHDKTFRVLCIDGGGIRGIIPALILAEIEERTQKPISQLFDYIAGTSTGGILSLGLVMPNAEGRPRYSAKDLVGLYQEKGANIFSVDAWKSISSGGGILDEKYSQVGIENTLQQYFGKTTLKDALTEVMVTSYDLETRRPYFFKSNKAKQDPRRNHLFWQAARATSAAPTYFEPFKLETDDELMYFSLVDGGVFANNPAMCAYAEVMRMAKNNKLFVVSLGTGEMSAQSISHDKAKDWGVAQWIKPLIDIMMDGNSDTVDYQLQQIIAADDDSEYYRLQAKLTKESSEMDNATKENIRKLKIIAQEVLADNLQMVDKICKRLVALSAIS